MIEKKKKQLKLIRSFILTQQIVSDHNKTYILNKITDLLTKVLISQALREYQDKIKSSVKDRGLAGRELSTDPSYIDYRILNEVIKRTAQANGDDPHKIKQQGLTATNVVLSNVKLIPEVLC